jgi:hypothetical protein
MAVQTISVPEAFRIEAKLLKVGDALRAMNRLAVQHDNGVDGETLSVAIETMTKQTYSEIASCVVMLGGADLGSIDATGVQ